MHKGALTTVRALVMWRHPGVYMKEVVQTQYTVRINRKSLSCQQIRAVFLTDLHNAADPAETQAVMDLIDAAEPDLVLCGGDMFIARPGIPVAPAVRFMKELAGRHTVWCGTGNHEYRAKIYPEQYGTMYAQYKYPLQEAGVIFLENQSAAVKCGNVPVRICGFDLPRRYYSRFHRSRMPVSILNSRFGRPDPDEVTILLAHNPAQIYAYLKWGADLTCCGHYHGGIMQLSGGRSLVGPDFRLFPRNAHGMIVKKQRHVVISAGIGEHTVPTRINNPRELVVIDLLVNAPEQE